MVAVALWRAWFIDPVRVHTPVVVVEFGGCRDTQETLGRDTASDQDYPVRQDSQNIIAASDIQEARPGLKLVLTSA